MAGLSEFFAMGGYALYVWASYAVAFLIMGALVWWTYRRMAQIDQNLGALKSVKAGARASETVDAGGTS